MDVDDFEVALPGVDELMCGSGPDDNYVAGAHVLTLAVDSPPACAAENKSNRVVGVRMQDRAARLRSVGQVRGDSHVALFISGEAVRHSRERKVGEFQVVHQ